MSNEEAKRKNLTIDEILNLLAGPKRPERGALEEFVYGMDTPELIAFCTLYAASLTQQVWKMDPNKTTGAAFVEYAKTARAASIEFALSESHQLGHLIRQTECQGETVVADLLTGLKNKS